MNIRFNPEYTSFVQIVYLFVEEGDSEPDLFGNLAAFGNGVMVPERFADLGL